MPALLSSESASRQLLTEFTTDWKRLKLQKHRFRGGVESRILLNLCLYYGEHYAQQSADKILTAGFLKDEDRNKLRLVFNLSKRAIRRKIGRLWGVQHEFYATPNTRDPRAYDLCDVVNKLIRGLDCTLSQKRQLWTKLFWLVIGGVVVEHVPWVPNQTVTPMPQYDEASGELLFVDHAERQEDGSPVVLPKSVVDSLVAQGLPQERFGIYEDLQVEGEVGSEIIDPLRFFIDNRITSISALPSDQACYIAEIKTVGWIRDTFGSEAAAAFTKAATSDLNIVNMRLTDMGPASAGINMLDLMPAIQGTRGANDPPMAILLTRYQPPHEGFGYGRATYFVPGVTVLHDGEIPYGAMPLVDTHWEPRATAFFSGDFATDLQAPQKFLNKRLSQMGEAANAQLYEVLLLGQGLTKDDVPSDMPGSVEGGLDENGNPKIAPLQRGILHPWFLESIRMVTELFEHISGSDLTSAQNRFNYLRGTNGLPILQELLDSEDGPFFSHFGEQEAKIRQLRLQRVQEFYPPTRTLHYTGSDLRDEVLEFSTDTVLRAGYEFMIGIDQGSLLPELSAVREAKVIARLGSPLAILYTNRRTNRLDPTRIALDLKYADRERESHEMQARKLARQLISRVMRGETLPSGIPLPTWDHDAMMDEYEAVMATMEFLEASDQTRQLLSQLYEAHRAILTKIHDQQMASVQNNMVQGAMAQATQQGAAQAASLTVNSVLEQLLAQRQTAAGSPSPSSPEDLIRAMLGGPQESGESLAAPPRRPIRPPGSPRPLPTPTPRR